ncbi:IS4 family transposase [Pedobacter arcticus]|uniref:IS4 family transposase n=1 Tax=Pedobacter arcticus TaxID=752140 RepID=UPI00030C5552|nr:IS4 family transposase [Pedobacter arcticus]
MSANLNIIRDIRSFINEVSDNPELRTCFTSSDRDFTRNRELDFQKTAVLLLNFLKKSYSLEILDFYQWLGYPETAVSKSAFCQQRAKIGSSFFAFLNLVLVCSFYENYADELKRWNGFLLIAIDGSTSHLVNRQEVIDHFGLHGNQRGVTAMGRLVTAFDVLNEITIKSAIQPISLSEQHTALSWVESYQADMLLLYDRGFPGFVTMFRHQYKEREQPYLMRCALGFNEEVKAFLRSGKKDSICTFKSNKQASQQLYEQGFKVPIGSELKVRLLKVRLDDGSLEVLATNLFDTEMYPYKDFKALYFMRWAIESRYDCLKNKLQLESYSGQKVNTIQQDFYCSVFLANLQTVISKACEPYLSGINKKRLHDYKINQNIAIGIMKNRIIDLFIHQNPENILLELEKLFSKYVEPVRNNRKNPHVQKFQRRKGKYRTLTNYKRAI